MLSIPDATLDSDSKHIDPDPIPDPLPPRELQEEYWVMEWPECPEYAELGGHGEQDNDRIEGDIAGEAVPLPFLDPLRDIWEAQGVSWGVIVGVNPGVRDGVRVGVYAGVYVGVYVGVVPAGVKDGLLAVVDT